MEDWTSKFKRSILAAVCAFLMIGISACSSEGRESVKSGENHGNSMESTLPMGMTVDQQTPVQYVYSCDTVTFTEYGDRVDVCEVAGNKEQIYILLEGKNWEEED